MTVRRLSDDRASTRDCCESLRRSRTSALASKVIGSAVQLYQWRHVEWSYPMPVRCMVMDADFDGLRRRSCMNSACIACFAAHSLSRDPRVRRIRPERSLKSRFYKIFTQDAKFVIFARFISVLNCYGLFNLQRRKGLYQSAVMRATVRRVSVRLYCAFPSRIAGRCW